MSLSSVVPMTAEWELRREQCWSRVMCIYCFEDIETGDDADGRPRRPHFCDQKAEAMRPAAPPPFN
jgi:hypothetical protein